jgi:vacuolar-type H+-ATPase subunit E/Vma4
MGWFGINIPDPIDEARKLAEATARAAAEAAANAAREADILRQNAEREAEIAAQNAGKTVEKAVQDTGATIEKAAQDVGRTLGQASNDTVAQLGRSYGDVVQLAEVSYHFIENNVEGINKSVAMAANRIEEGKLVDAVWGVMTDPLRIQEQAAADAVMESSVLNVIASSAATVYGGPAGAAAYAAWYTYKATGNLDAALKAGAIAWATSTANEATKTIEGATFDNQAKRVLSSAAIGGAAIAASGGTDEQVLAAFGRGAVVGLAREGYSAVTKRPLDGSPATKPAVLKETAEIRSAYRTLDNGNLDITSMPADISHVGISTDVVAPGYFSPLETGGLMQDLSKIPYVNSMAYFHDQWMAITNLQGVAVQVTILPAIALTGFGTEGAQNNIGTEHVVDETKKKQGN